MTDLDGLESAAEGLVEGPLHQPLEPPLEPLESHGRECTEQSLATEPARAPAEHLEVRGRLRGQRRSFVGWAVGYPVALRASGGIGRRAGFRCLCPKGCGGSSPPSPTVFQVTFDGRVLRGAEVLVHGATVAEDAPVAIEPQTQRRSLGLAIGLAVIAVVAVVFAPRDHPRQPGVLLRLDRVPGHRGNLLDGRGLTTPFNLPFNPYSPAQAVAFHGEFPLTHYPPLYPVVLAVFARFGGGLIGVARVLNALLFGVNVVLAGLLVWRITRSTAIALVSAFGFVMTVNVVVNHGLVMSEPLMIAIVFGGALLTPWMLRRPTLASTAAVGAAARRQPRSTRIVGVAFVVAVVVAALLWMARPWRQRVRCSVLLAVLGLGPLVAWVAVTRAVSGASDRPLRVHLPSSVFYDTFLDTVTGWLFGAGGDRTLHAVVLGALVLAAVGLGVVVACDRLPPSATAAARRERDDSNNLLGVLALFAGCYLAMLFVSAALFDVATASDGRVLLPVQMAIAVVVIGLVHRVASRVAGRAVAVSAVVLIVVICAWPWRSIAQGFGTVSTVDLLDHPAFPAPTRSPLAAAVGRLPDDAAVASTFPSTLWSGSGHDVIFIPPRYYQVAGDTNDDFRKQLVELGRILTRRHGYVVLYGAVPSEFVTTGELARILKLVEVQRFAEGALYRVEGLQPGVR